MKDWIDIIGKELESILEPLPAHDWQLLQQKYTASRKRKGRTAFAWWGAAIPVAAAIILALLLYTPHTPVADETLVAETFPPTPPAEDILPDNLQEITSEEIVPEITNTVSPEDVLPSDTPEVSSDETVPDNTNTVLPDDVPPGNTPTSIPTEDVVPDVAVGNNTQKENSHTETSVLDNFIADAEVQQDKNKPFTDDFPLEKPERRRYPVSIGVSGSICGGFASGGDAASSNTTIMPPQIDSLTLQKNYLTKGYSTDKGWRDNYEHEMPISFGISARFMLSDEFAVNTGLNYTQYKSERRRYHYITGKTESDKQSVHYIGIPVRFDLLLINKKAINLYIGGGFQAEKCIYATVGNGKLHEKPFIWSASAVAGLQLNITPGYGIFFEPEISTTLNNGTIETFRTEKSTMKSFRAGLRFNF